MESGSKMESGSGSGKEFAGEGDLESSSEQACCTQNAFDTEGTEGTQREGCQGGTIIPRMMAMAEEPEETWARRRKRNPKWLGEIAEAAFLLRAADLGLGVAKPWGDSERFDFIVWTGRRGRMRRVQVKSSERLFGRGYEVQPVYSVAGKGKVELTAEDIDVLAAYVRGLDVWYVLPVEAFAPAKSLRFYPDVECEGAEWEEWREAWGVLEKSGERRKGQNPRRARKGGK